jgi:tetratricopeptide (TPR) repeat protein
VELLRSVQSTSNVTLGVNAHRAEGSAFYNHKQYDEALEAWKRGLEKYPDDWEMNNNVAFVLSKMLGRHADAVPFAEHAAKMNPNSPEIQDTLGVVYTMTGQHDKARLALQKALDESRAGSDSQVTILVHLALLDLALGNKEAAAARAKEAEDILNVMPAQRQSLKDEVADLFDKLR